MVMTLEGIYRDGKVELADKPAGVEEARVLVVFLPRQKPVDEAQETARQEAMQRLLARAKQGLDLGGPPYPKREELYDRFEGR